MSGKRGSTGTNKKGRKAASDDEEFTFQSLYQAAEEKFAKWRSAIKKGKAAAANEEGGKTVKCSAADASAKLRLERFTRVDNAYKDLHDMWVKMDAELAVFWQLKLKDNNAEFLPKLKSFYLEAKVVFAAYKVPTTDIVRQAKKIDKEIAGVEPQSAEFHKEFLSLIINDAFILLDKIRQGLVCF